MIRITTKCPTVYGEGGLGGPVVFECDERRGAETLVALGLDIIRTGQPMPEGYSFTMEVLS